MSSHSPHHEKGVLEVFVPGNTEMSRYQDINTLKKRFHKRSNRIRRIFYYVIGTGITAALIFVAGFFLIQLLIHRRIQSYSATDGANFSSVDTLSTMEELNFSELGEDFASLSFYQMGWDNDGRPVWMLELGKLDLRGIVSKNEANIVKIDHLGTQAAAQIAFSMKQAEPKLSRKAWVVLINLDGYSFYQFTSYTAVDVMLKFLSKIMPLVEHADYGYFINLNYVSYALLKIVRPILGEAINRIIVETDPEDWMPALKSRIPLQYIPKKFGGYSNYTCRTPFCTFYRP